MSTAGRATQNARLGAPVVLSAALHMVLLAGLIVMRAPTPPPTPPIYRVNIVAAPPGPRLAGIVTRQPEPPPAKPAPVPVRAESNPKAMPLPTKKPPARKQTAAATPVPVPEKPAKTKAEEAPHAGGGATGGRGTDVATVRTDGIEFPYQGYLDNIVRQIAVRFQPPANATVRAVVRFLIHRDGSVSDINFVSRSGIFEFDLDAQGAVEQAGSVRAFGPLPSGFPDDVLPVIFSFDPRVLH